VLEDLGVRLGVVHRKAGPPPLPPTRRALASRSLDLCRRFHRPGCELSPQLTAFFKSAAILGSYRWPASGPHPQLAGYVVGNPAGGGATAAHI
jgi:hypothetical protein